MTELTRLATEMLATPHVAQIIITNNDNRKLVDLTSPTVTNGTLKVGSATAIPSATTLTLGPGTFDLNSNSVAVAGLSRTFGVLPTADGGQAVRAVLEAPR